MEKEDIGTGLVRSPVDIRDHILSAYSPTPINIPKEFPPTFDLTVHNQGSEPSCVGYACASIKEDKEIRENNRVVFDGSWIYKECKKIDGMPETAGTFFRSGLKVLKEIGTMPKGGGDPEQFKIGSYALVDDNSFEGLKKAFVVNGALLIGYKYSKNGWKDAYIRPPEEGERVTGHAVKMIGYTEDHLIIHNSHGEKVAKGRYYVPKGYDPIEAWAILTDLPTGEVKYQGRIGWVAEAYLDDYKVLPEIGLRLRQGAGVDYQTIEVLPKGKEVEPLGERLFRDGYWWARVRVV